MRIAFILQFLLMNLLGCDSNALQQIHQSQVDDVFFSSNKSRQFYMANLDANLVEPIPMPSGYVLIHASNAFFSAGDNRIYAIGAGGEDFRPGILSLDVQGQLALRFETEAHLSVFAMAPSSDGSRLFAVASGTGPDSVSMTWAVLEFSLPDGHLERVIPLEPKLLEYHPQALAVSPHGRWILLTVAYYGDKGVAAGLDFSKTQSIVTVDLDSGRVVDEIPVDRMLKSITFSPDGTSAVFYSFVSRKAYRWDAATQSVMHLFDIPDSGGEYLFAEFLTAIDIANILFYFENADGRASVWVLAPDGTVIKEVPYDFRGRFAAVSTTGNIYFREFDPPWLVDPLRESHPSTSAPAGATLEETFHIVDGATLEYLRSTEIQLPVDTFTSGLFKFAVP